MSLIIADRLTKRFGGVAVLEGVSVQLGAQQRVGLIGPNGSGKTTLLNLLADCDAADEGRCQTVGGATIGYLTQESRLSGPDTLHQALRATFAPLLDVEREMKALEPRLSGGDPALIRRYDELHHAFETEGGYTLESRIQTVLHGLGFSATDADAPLDQLSGGQAARAALAQLLLAEPDVLLLDEPTNHLDTAALAWLEDFLSRWKRAYVIASHDRHLLDRLVDRIWAIHDRSLRTYAGNYSAYVAQRQEEIRLQWEAYHQQKAYLEKSQDFIQRNIFDKKTTKQAQARRKQLEKLERVGPPRKTRQLSFEIAFPRPSGQRVLRLQDVKVGYPASDANAPVTLFDVEHAILDQGQRVALIGPNGSGKTTLLKALTDQLPLLQGQLEWGPHVQPAYFAQAAWDTFHQDTTVVDALAAAPGWTISMARELLGRFLFSGETVFKKLGQLSGGERSRVALARLAQLGGNLLLLDEPTNHLDIPARETLEDVLLEYPGTILFVSHDRYFIQKLATQVWDIEDKALRVYRGDYAFYLRKKAPSVPVQPEAATAPAEASKLSPGKQKRQHERDVAKLERQEAELAVKLHAVEGQIAQVETDLERASYAQDLARIQDLNAAYEALKGELALALAAWEEAAESLEARRAEFQRFLATSS